MSEPLLIAGGGIGGLALALALARKGIPCRVLERRARFSEAGAGIQIGPNGVRVLVALGVADALAPCVGVPEEIAVVDGAAGRVLQRLPLGTWLAERHGAPYWVAHRADLQAALLDRVRSAPSIELTMGFDVAAIEELEDSIVVTSRDGHRSEGRALIGADGIWSFVRRWHVPGSEPVASGQVAMRTVVERRDGEGLFSQPVVGAWLSGSGHAVHYPVSGGRQVAVVVITSGAGPADEEVWARPVDRNSVLTCAVDFAPELRRFIARGTDWRSWSIMAAPSLRSWCHGRVTLLGDAAHPILPFLAQGGVMALEDASVLADRLERHPNEPATAFSDYETVRLSRVQHVMAASQRNGKIYHSTGPLALARNLAMTALGGKRIMSQYDWIYGWRPD